MGRFRSVPTTDRQYLQTSVENSNVICYPAYARTTYPDTGSCTLTLLSNKGPVDCRGKELNRNQENRVKQKSGEVVRMLSSSQGNISSWKHFYREESSSRYQRSPFGAPTGMTQLQCARLWPIAATELGFAAAR